MFNALLYVILIKNEMFSNLLMAHQLEEKIQVNMQ